MDRRTVLRAALAAAATAAVGESVAGCDTSHPKASAPTGGLGGASASVPSGAPSSANPPATSAAGLASPTATGATTAAPSSARPPVATASPSRSSAGPATEIVHGPASAAGVALTFHGAGDPVLAKELLSRAEADGAKLTVLAVGTWLEQYPDMAKRILDGGHELGNHTYRHLTMPRLDATTDLSEIVKCALVLRSLTGSPGRWFRPSGTTRATPAILAAAGRAGYAECLSYDIDPQDYTDPGTTQVVTRVLDAVRAGSIVSLHLGHRGTVEAIPAILLGLRSRGLPAVSMSSLMAT
jgi:peptidoglycan/xylan/chitin deacetylase (PgdA/CDA1 family)